MILGESKEGYRAEFFAVSLPNIDGVEMNDYQYVVTDIADGMIFFREVGLPNNSYSWPTKHIMYFLDQIELSS